MTIEDPRVGEVFESSRTLSDGNSYQKIWMEVVEVFPDKSFVGHVRARKDTRAAVIDTVHMMAPGDAPSELLEAVERLRPGIVAPR
jgi:hypothetical protein